VRLQNIGFAEFRGDDAAYIPEEHYATLGNHDVHGGDILIAGLGDPRNHPGRACVAPDYLGNAMVKADCFRFRPLADVIDAQFLAYQLSATSAVAGHMLSTGATRQRVNLRATADRTVAIPPLSEQQQIVCFIEPKTQATADGIERINREIDLIREYRTRLIADVVTGQLDVREAAAALPEIELEETGALLGDEGDESESADAAD
jgi:type I restriction enzyme S subunit